MSWFDKLFGEDEPSDQTSFNKKRSTVRKSENRDLIPQSNDVYQRPKGKFRFPIAMDGYYSDSQQQQKIMQETHRHATRQRQGFQTNRKTRRHRGQRLDHMQHYSAHTLKSKEDMNGTSMKKNDNHTSLSQQHRSKQRLSSNVHNPYTNGSTSKETRCPNTPTNKNNTFLHQEFKASEVPSAIFGTQERKPIQNSGLSQPPGVRSKQTQQSSNKKPTSQAKMPSHSKRDNTVNIENIYASQIVDEIRKEREKKVLQKKRFKEALQHKKASHMAEEQSDIQKAIDEMYASQARHLLGEHYKQEQQDLTHQDTTPQEPSENHGSELKENEPFHESSIEYEEIDLDQITSSHTTSDSKTNEDKGFDTRQHVQDDKELFDKEIIQHETERHEIRGNSSIDKATKSSEEEMDYSETEDKTEHQVDGFFNDYPEESENLASDDFFEVHHSTQDEVNEPEEQPLVATSDEANQRFNQEHSHVKDESCKVTTYTVDEPQLTPTKEFQDKIDDSEKSSEEGLIKKHDNNETVSTDSGVSEPSLKPHIHDIKKSEEVKRPIRKGSKPFNVVMTPSDKKRMMQRQKANHSMSETNSKAIKPTQNIQVTKNEIVQQAHSPALSECVNSPKKVTSNKTESQDTSKKIRRGPILNLPSIDLLDQPEIQESDNAWIKDKKQQLNDAFYYFNVPAEVVNVIEGPSVTRFELSVERGVKVSRITALQDDIKMALAAKDIRIEAPIPGTSLVGIEVPNQHPTKVNLRSILETEMFKNAESKLTVAMGNRINNEPLLMDIAKTPHALIAGATGSGKSVSINSILLSLLYRNHPEELKLLLIDPKMVELAPYNDLPHLVAPVITDVKAATQSLKWAVEEMERRYKLFAQTHVRNITAFNKKVNYDQRMPKIVIVIDELADLMMMAPQEVEQSIARIAQKARACGIHMLVATQRPSVNVITGLIKANIPTRVAFMVSSSVDSRTILDSGGAERLLGYGDMLYLGGGMNKPIRVQGTFVSDEEIDEVVDYIKSQREPEYLFQEKELLKKTEEPTKDELFNEVCEFMVKERHISTSLIQRHFQIGYNRAARIIDQLEQLGYISGANGSKPRDVFLTEADLQDS